MKLLGEKPQFPKIKHGYYLIQFLQELSFGQYSGGVFTYLDYDKIKSWINLSGVDISFIEIKALIQLSKAYCNTIIEAKDKDFKPPFMI